MPLTPEWQDRHGAEPHAPVGSGGSGISALRTPVNGSGGFCRPSRVHTSARPLALSKLLRAVNATNYSLPSRVTTRVGVEGTAHA